jgi:putative FmdB family regulatory protein
MPNYDYFCDLCDHSFEVFQKISDQELKCCPSCNKVGLRRGIGGVGTRFQFKGSGFYQTDYCKKEEGRSCSCKEKD